MFVIEVSNDKWKVVLEPDQTQDINLHEVAMILFEYM